MIPAFLRRGAALCLAAAAAWLLPLSGCFGGTTSEGGNPGITLQFTKDGQPARYSGFIQIVAKDSNPDFFRLPPADGSTSPSVIVGGAPAISLLLVSDAPEVKFSWEDLARSLYAHAELPLAKRAAAAFRRTGTLPDFNVILIGKDSLAGWLQGVHPDPDGPYTVPGAGDGYAFKVDVGREHRYSGQVDTTGPAGRPLALFVPGTPYYAAVHGDRFRFDGIPAGRLPLRWLSASGRVHAMPESLGTAPELTGNDHLFKSPLTAGAKVDSLKLPAEVPTLSAPSAEPAGQFAFTDSVAVTLKAAAGASIYYTTDGSDPDLGSKPYAKPILLKASATIRAIAYLKGHNKSPIAVNNYILVPAAPVALPTTAAFRDSLEITLSAKNAGAVIRYTLDESEPNGGSPAYAGPLRIFATTVLKAVAIVPGLGPSAVIVHKYTREGDTADAPPVPSPKPMTFIDSLAVSLFPGSPGATVHFTLDGSAPTANSPAYSAPVLLTATTTLKAIAVKGGRQSPVLSATYVKADSSQAPAEHPQ